MVLFFNLDFDPDSCGYFQVMTPLCYVSKKGNGNPCIVVPLAPFQR